VELDFPGYAIGGVSVGESKGEMMAAVDATVPHLPADKPRYLMGVGPPEDFLEAIGRGVDMFDCVMPTRNARNGSLFTSEGRINIKNACYARDFVRGRYCPCGSILYTTYSLCYNWLIVRVRRYLRAVSWRSRARFLILISLNGK
jgi:queuine tRNA-ribosyltransferase